MKERKETVGQVKKPYEEPTLVEREGLLQITEAPILVSISEGAPVPT
jgi:hypothetical protein